MKKVFFSFMPLLFLLFGYSLGRDLILLGFNGQNSPSIGKTYDRLLRERLSIRSDIQLSDYIQCQRYKKMIKFEDYPTVSIDNIESIAKYVKDTTFFVWGTVEKFQVVPNRRWLIQAQIRGELKISLNMYNLSEQRLVYAGTISCVEFENKGLVFFTPVSKSIHISALDQTDILEKLEYKAVDKSSQMISAAIRSEIARKEKKGESKDSLIAKEIKKEVKDSLGSDSTTKDSLESSADSSQEKIGSVEKQTVNQR